MSSEQIAKLQQFLFLTGFGSLMIGLGTKLSVSREASGKYIDMIYFLDHISDASIFAWIYWLCIATFVATFIPCAVLQYLKDRS